MVALENLRAMCEHVSGTCHRYWIEKVSRSRVHVGYSNPDEYGHESPMFAVFPCYPSDDADNPHVVLDYLNVVHDSRDGEGWQCFEILRDCPVMWRDPGIDSVKGQTWTAFPEEHIINAIRTLYLALGDSFGTDFAFTIMGRGVPLAASSLVDGRVQPNENRKAIAAAIRAHREDMQPKY